MARLLVVDDDIAMTKLLKTLLELEGFEVMTAIRGSDAQRVAVETPPDLFLLDFHLPDMEGVELIHLLRAIPQFTQTPIMVVSGRYVEPEVLAAGASAFMMKPYDTGELSSVMRQLIGG
jgi:DNA-binding response OmpR family regulator